MTPPKCELCGTEHHGHQAHVFATNTKPLATNAATNKVASRKVVIASVPAKLAGAAVGTGVAHPKNAKTLNRRARSAYNAYQRFLMQARRAISSGRACPWPQ